MTSATRRAAAPACQGVRLEAWDAANEAEWEALALRSGGCTFARPGWVRPVRDLSLGSRRPLLAVLRGTAGLRAVLPLVGSGRRLSSPTNWHTPVFSPVAETPQALRELADGVLALPARSTSLRFLPEDCAAVFAQAAATARVPALARSGQHSPFVDVDREPGEFWDKFSARWRRTVRRQTRRLEERGQVSWDWHDGRTGWQDALTEGLAVEARSWKGRTGTAISSDPALLQTYTALCAWAADQGLLRLALLRLDGRPIAFDLLVRDHCGLHSVKAGYDPAFATVSPGTLNFVRVLELALRDEELRTVELLGDADAWKLRLADGVRRRDVVTLFQNPVTGPFDRAVQQAVEHGRAWSGRHAPALRDALARLARPRH